VDLIHPHSKRDVVDALRTASAAETRVLTVGGRQHIDKGNPSEVDAELWTTLLDDRVAYDPAEMLCVVEAGMRIHDLRTILAEGGQECRSTRPMTRRSAGWSPRAVRRSGNSASARCATPSSRWRS